MLNWKIVVLLFVVLILGFLRELVFESVNSLIEQTTDQNRLKALKWALTLLFMGLYLWITLGVVRLLFSERSYLQLTLIFYGLFFFASFLLFAGGYVLEQEIGYTMARRLMGMAQSPVLGMILVAGFYFARRLKT